MSLVVSVHPDRFLNEPFHGHCLEVEYPVHDLIYTKASRLFDADAAPCTTAKLAVVETTDDAVIIDRLDELLPEMVACKVS